MREGGRDGGRTIQRIKIGGRRDREEDRRRKEERHVGKGRNMDEEKKREQRR